MVREAQNAWLVTCYDDDLFVLVSYNFKWKLRVKDPSDERWFWPADILEPEVSCDLFVLVPLRYTSKTLKLLNLICAWNGDQLVKITLTALGFFWGGIFSTLSYCRRA